MKEGAIDDLAGLIRRAGWVGLIGASLVGVGEYTIQFSLTGEYASPGYEYFAEISRTRLFLGHYLSVLCAPLYLVGYWHLGKNLAPANPRAANLFFLFGSYSFAVGSVWLGQRAFLALTVQSMVAGLSLRPLLDEFSLLNEPLVNVLRVAVLLNSIIWVWLIRSGRSRYPSWIAWLCPIALLGAIFGLYVASPEIGRYLLPGAMNVVHVLLFAASLWATRHEVPRKRI